MAGQGWRSRISDTSLTDWNQAGNLSALLVKYHSEIGDAMALMLDDPSFAVLFITRLRHYWGFIRALVIQKKTTLMPRAASIDKRFTAALTMAQGYSNQKSGWYGSIVAYEKLISFYDEIKLVTQLTGFAIPVKREKLDEDERISSIRDA